MWWLLIIKFLLAFVGIASLLLFVINCIMLTIAPEIIVNEKGESYEKHTGSRLWLAVIVAFCGALLLIL